MHGRYGDPTRFGNLCGFARGCQRLIDDLRALAPPGARFRVQPLQDRLWGQMGGGAGEVVSHTARPPLLRLQSFLATTSERALVGSL